MRKLIVNGDDFGFNREITDGIIECYRAGILTSTTLMVNMPAAQYAAEESKKHPNLSVGIHLNLSVGKPVSEPGTIAELIGPDGNFRDYIDVFRKANRFQLSSEQIEREFSAQIEKFFGFGITPSHCDSHHHVAACLQTFPIKIKVLSRYNIKRLRTHRGFYRPDKTSPQKLRLFLKMLRANAEKLPNRLYYELQHIYCGLKNLRFPDVRYGFSKVISSSPLKFDIEGWRTLIENMPRGVAELAVHPGLPSDDPMDEPMFRKRRVVEYNLLVNPECKKICQEYDVKLISFNEL